MLRITHTVLLLLSTCLLQAQTGPNNPGTRVNNNTIGTNAWASINQVASNNNNYATCATKGTTQYLAATGYAFAIAGTQQIDGILVEIDKSTTSFTSVAQLDAWSTGMSKTISTGTARCLLAVVVMENGLGTRNITSFTYGGQAMTSVLQATVGTNGGFIGKIEYFMLLEAGITAASSTNFSISYDATGTQENWEAVSSAVYQYVDQTVPIFDTETLISNNATNPVTLGSAITCGAGGYVVSTIFCGNNRTPAATPGQSNNYSITAAFVETIDTYSANAGASTSGGAWQIAHLPLAAGGSSTPSYTFAGTVNRQVAALLSLQNLREYDNSVRLVKANAIVGNNYAFLNAAWPMADAYSTYGGATDLWGTTWTPAEVNNAGFGAAISAIVQNGTARIDHMRITIFHSLNMPVELREFYGERNGNQNILHWVTQTEIRNHSFVIERADADGNFVPLHEQPGQGHSVIPKTYAFTDQAPLPGINYYRLKQVDEDGQFSYSWIIAVRDQEDLSELQPYPNPSDGYFNLSNRESATQMQLFDANMKLLKVIDQDAEAITIRELPDGIYFIVYKQAGLYKTKQVTKSSR